MTIDDFFMVMEPVVLVAFVVFFVVVKAQEDKNFKPFALYVCPFFALMGIHMLVCAYFTRSFLWMLSSGIWFFPMVLVINRLVSRNDFTDNPQVKK